MIWRKREGIEEMDVNFFDWNVLGSFAGAVAAVSVLTQVTKELPVIRKLPTQTWSYGLSLALQLCVLAFGGEMSASGTVLALLNAALVSLASNGGYAAVKRIFSGSAGGNGAA